MIFNIFKNMEPIPQEEIDRLRKRADEDETGGWANSLKAYDRAKNFNKILEVFKEHHISSGGYGGVHVMIDNKFIINTKDFRWTTKSRGSNQSWYYMKGLEHFRDNYVKKDHKN